MFYLDIIARQSTRIEHPQPGTDAALFVLEGSVTIDDYTFAEGEFVVLDDEQELFFNKFARLILIGGKRFEAEPFMNWNFVSFSKERLEAARERWQKNNFPKVTGDEEEFVPLP